MTNKNELENQVRDALNSGKPRDDIKKSLLEAGWQEADITEAFGILEMPPASPPPIETQFQLNSFRESRSLFGSN